MSKGAARNRKTISLASPAMLLLLSSARTIGANRNDFRGHPPAPRPRPGSDHHRSAPASQRHLLARVVACAASPLVPMPASPAMPLSPGGHPQQDPMRHAE